MTEPTEYGYTAADIERAAQQRTTERNEAEDLADAVEAAATAARWVAVITYPGDEFTTLYGVTGGTVSTLNELMRRRPADRVPLRFTEVEPDHDDTVRLYIDLADARAVRIRAAENDDDHDRSAPQAVHALRYGTAGHIMRVKL